MFGYIVRRVISGLLVLVAISVAAFALFFYGPSDPALAYCPETKCTPQRLENITEQLGLDRPVIVQYADYMKGIVAGNEFQPGAISIPCDAPCLGVSFKLRDDVADIPVEPVPGDPVAGASAARVIFLTLGVTYGHARGEKTGNRRRQGHRRQPACRDQRDPLLPARPARLPLPDQRVGHLPRERLRVALQGGPVAWALGAAPSLAGHGLHDSTQYARFSRGSMIESMSEDYVRTARAKGLSERRVTLEARRCARPWCRS